MAVRKQRATTKEKIMSTDIKVVIKDGKATYKDFTGEFYVFETRENSGCYFSDSYKLTDNYIQHWKFNGNKWEEI
jgi:hypothetical protein